MAGRHSLGTSQARYRRQEERSEHVNGNRQLKIGITCYPSLGGSGVVATELGKLLARKGIKSILLPTACRFRLGQFRKTFSTMKLKSATITSSNIRRTTCLWRAKWRKWPRCSIWTCCMSITRCRMPFALFWRKDGRRQAESRDDASRYRYYHFGPGRVAKRPDSAWRLTKATPLPRFPTI